MSTKLIANQAISTINDLIALIHKEQWIAVVREQTEEDGLWVAEALIQSGIQLIELTATTPNAHEIISVLSEKYPNAIIGAGSILNSQQAIEMLDTGAQFIVSPIMDKGLIEFGKAENILVIPGGTTPNELYQGTQWDASVVKFFPAENLGGVDYLKAILAPLPELKIIPTGGVCLNNYPDYIRSGAWGVGVGSHLAPQEWVQTRNQTNIQNRVKEYLTKRMELQNEH